MSFVPRSLFVALVFGTCGAAFAQTVPTPPGQFNFYVVADQFAPGVEELVILNPDVPGGPYLSSAILGAPIASTLNRRSQSTPAEAQPILVVDATGNTIPHVVVPTLIAAGPGFGNFLYVESFHDGAPAPCATAVTPGTVATCQVFLGSGDGFAIDYDLLDIGGGVVLAEFSDTVTGTTSVTAITFASGLFPVAGTTWVFNQLPTPYATRMTLAAGGNRVLVPLLNGIGVIDPTLATPVATISTRGNGGGVQYQVGTNLAAGFNSRMGQTIVFGLRLPGATPGTIAAGHSAGYLNPTTLAVTFAGINPFGAGRALAPGFNEVAIGGTAAAPVAVFLTATPTAPAGGNPGPGGFGLFAGSATGVLTFAGAVTTPAGVPLGSFGNPEVPRAGVPADPVCFYAAAPGGGPDYFVAVGLGLTSPIASVAPAVLLPGFVNPMAGDRPFNLPGGGDFVVDNQAPNAVLVFSVAGGAAAPVISPPAIFATLGGSTSMTNIFAGPAPAFGLNNVPAALLGAFMNDVVVIGAPLAAPPTSATFVDPVPSGVNPPTGLFTWLPGAPQLVPNMGARIGVFNVSTLLDSAPPSPIFAIPGGSGAPAATSFIKFVGGYIAGTLFYVPFSGLSLTSQIAAF